MSAMTSRDTTAPSATLADVAPALRNTPVESVTLNFTEPVGPKTLKAQALGLTRNGGAVAFGPGVAFAKVTPTSYRVTGLGGLTAAEGVYTLTFDTKGVTDLAGNAAGGVVGTTWMTDVTPPVFTNVPP
jgi:hypothetical protein